MSLRLAGRVLCARRAAPAARTFRSSARCLEGKDAKAVEKVASAPKPVVKGEIKKEAPKPAASSGGGFRSNLLSFALGASVAGGAGYYQLQQDVAEAGAATDAAISKLRADLVDVNAKLHKRVSALEGL